MHCMGMEMRSQTRALAPSMGTETFSHAAVVCEPGSFPIANFADFAMGCSSPATRLELAPRCSASHVTGATGDACGRNLRSRTAGESALSSRQEACQPKRSRFLFPQDYCYAGLSPWFRLRVTPIKVGILSMPYPTSSFLGLTGLKRSSFFDARFPSASSLSGRNSLHLSCQKVEILCGTPGRRLFDP